MRGSSLVRGVGQALNVKLIACKSHANICKRSRAAGPTAPASSLLGEAWGGFASGSAWRLGCLGSPSAFKLVVRVGWFSMLPCLRDVTWEDRRNWVVGEAAEVPVACDAIRA